jgi:hypothetical protein
MLELLRMAGKGRVGLEGIEGREWKGKMNGKGRRERKGGRIVTDGRYMPLN